MDYDKPPGPRSDKGKTYIDPDISYHGGNLIRYHFPPLHDKGKLCGLPKSPPKSPLGASDDLPLELLDDMFWPATYADMPLLRELAFTPLQYKSFEKWQGDPAVKGVGDIFKVMFPASLQSSFAGPGDADQYFAAFLAERPNFAPAVIDMAHLGSMIGGSFLPGIEVGREGGIATNWSLFDGGSRYFPDLRFKPSRSTSGHTVGTLTKDLAVPWSKDFHECDETYWPTARPGMVLTASATQVKWLPTETELAHFLHKPSISSVEYVKECWKALGFIRRNISDDFIEQESWRP
jgi:hypothetical protein